jgi:hypothetical protein
MAVSRFAANNPAHRPIMPQAATATPAPARPIEASSSAVGRSEREEGDAGHCDCSRANDMNLASDISGILKIPLAPLEQED